MIPDLNIYRSAQVLVKQHRQDAPVEAAMRADAMLDKGDPDGYAVWKMGLNLAKELSYSIPGSLHAPSPQLSL